MSKWLWILSFLCCANLYANESYLFDFGEDLDWISIDSPEYCDSISKECYRFATPRRVDFETKKVGSIATFDDGLFVWSLGLTSEGSKNMNVIFSDVDLKIGDVIYVYDPFAEKIQKYDFRRKCRNGYLQTFPISGDSIIIEYQSTQGREPTFKVETVNCGFRNIFSEKATPGFGGAESCEKNASCNDNISDITRSVCRLMINGNTYGSGVLVNNTSQDGTPYVMTAAHIFNGSKEFTTLVARFGWDSPNCQDKAYSTDYEDIEGGELITYNDLRDCALILLDSAPTQNVMPYWAGWDCSETYHGETSTCIHHPYGDVKKVSIGLSPYQSTYSGKTIDGKMMTVSNHWRVLIWSSGATEGGSSGSPLFDENKRVVGCLTGGEASCKNPMNDYFWQISGSWNDTEQTAKMNLQEALDPTNTGKTQLNGLDFSDEEFKDIYNVDEYNTFVSAEDCNFMSERFPNEKKYKYLYGMFVGVESVSRVVSDFRVYVYSDESGKPGKEIRSYDFDTSNFEKGTISYLDFGEAIEIDTSFHLAIEKDGDFLQFYYSKTASRDYANFYYDNQWQSYKEMTGEDVNCSIFFGARMSSPPMSIKEVGMDDESDGIQIRRDGSKLTVYGKDFTFVGLYSLDGKVAVNFTKFDVNQRSIEIDLSSLQLGMYILRVKTEGGRKSQKILVY